MMGRRIAGFAVLVTGGEQAHVNASKFREE
jgi:hypothetical protein